MRNIKICAFIAAACLAGYFYAYKHASYAADRVSQCSVLRQEKRTLTTELRLGLRGDLADEMNKRIQAVDDVLVRNGC